MPRGRPPMIAPNRINKVTEGLRLCGSGMRCGKCPYNEAQGQRVQPGNYCFRRMCLDAAKLIDDMDTRKKKKTEGRQ